jgi:hypothetical protein
MKRRIPLKTIVDSYKLKKSDENLLRTQIKSIDLVSVLDSETTFLYSKETSDLNYEQIFVLDVELKSTNKNISLDKKLQSFFPNPTLIFYKYNEKFKLSSADKRLNLNDKTQSVVKDVFSSDFIDLEDKTLENVIMKLNYENKRYKNILELYKYYQNVIFGMVLKDILGYYPEKLFEAVFIKTAIKELEELKSELNQLNDEEKNLIGMNDKMEVHTKRTKIIEQQEKIKFRFTEDE